MGKNNKMNTRVALCALCACLLLAGCDTQTEDEATEPSATVVAETIETDDATQENSDAVPDEAPEEGAGRPADGEMAEGMERPADGEMPEGGAPETEASTEASTEAVDPADLISSEVVVESAEDVATEATESVTTEVVVEEEAVAVAPTSGTIYGRVKYIYGNYICLRLGTWEGETPDMSAGGTSSASGASGEMPSGDAAAGGSGASSGADREMPSDGDMPDMSSMGGMSGMGGMTMSATTDSDMSEYINLTSEYYEYTIPVGTVVDAFGSETTFSSITADLYLSMTFNDDGKIVAISVLG